MLRKCGIVIALSMLMFTVQNRAQNVTIDFEDYTTSGAAGLPEPPGSYSGFVWEHVLYGSEGATPRVVSNAQLSAWGAPRTATSGVYQLYVSETESKITITPSSGGAFNFISAQFVRYNNSSLGANTIWITGYINGGGTVSTSFAVTNNYQLKTFTNMTNLSSLVITGGSGTARLWLMDDFTYNTDPEMDVQGNGQSIISGDDTPSSADHTDFGEAAVSGGTVVRTFTILNTGAGALSLSGSPRVSVSPSTDFTVTSQPAVSSVSAGSSTTFQITFDPASEGAKTATVSIANNDTDENPYTFDITGTGANIAPEIHVKQGTTDIADGGTYGFGSQNQGTDTDAVFTIENNGNAALTLSGSPIVVLGGTNPGQFSVQGQPISPVAASGSTTFTIRFSPTSAGAKSATVAIANDDSDENPYNITFTGTCLAPEINVKRGSTDIASGGSTAFGSQATGYYTDVGLTVENLGTTNLTLSTATLSGTNAAEFSVEAQPSSPVSAASNTTMTVRFSPATTGAKTATLSIPNNDSNENPYTVTLTGTGVVPVPEIGLKQDGTAIADGGTYYFGRHTLGHNADADFTIENTGNGNLTLSGSPVITIGGTDASQFSVQAQPVSPVSPSGSTTFTIRFSPSSTGSKSASIAIGSDDSDENPYNLTLTGDGTTALLVRFDDVTTSPHGTVPTPYENFNWHGSAVASDAELQGFGWTGNSPSGDYQVRVGEEDDVTINPVINNFNLNEIQIAQYHYSSATSLTFTGTTSTGGTVVETAALSSTAYKRVTFSQLNDLVELVITSNGAWLFDDFGYVMPPEIDIQGNGVSIVNGDDSPDPADHTDFGIMNIGAGSIARTFTIRNTGSANLTLSGSPSVSLSGSSDFSVTQQPASATIGAGGSVQCEITFTPSSIGPLSALVSVQNTDSDENPYTFEIQATGDLPLPVELTSFSAVLTTAGIRIEWRTESETDHLGFVLERQDSESNEDTWILIASYQTDEALQGHGGVSSGTQYMVVDEHIEPGCSYSYRLTDVNHAGETHIYDVIEISMPDAPAETVLSPPFPNPFNPETNIAYSLKESGRVDITVYDLLGRSVVTLFSGPQIAGTYHVYWRGRDEKGMPVPSGEYIIRMESERNVQIKKVLFMK
ncbi:choice-of-anchor D domain-containing protein [bacterium]|nr:choice-of-anchor D domain-containing protein [bacterium]